MNIVISIIYCFAAAWFMHHDQVGAGLWLWFAAIFLVASE